jgi:hypothetical protein
LADPFGISAYRFCRRVGQGMQSQELALKDRVSVQNPIAYGGGTSSFKGLSGTVTRVHRGGRAVDVELDEYPKDPLWFFVRELDKLS